MKNISKNHALRRGFFLFLLILFLVVFYVILYKIYMPRVNAFGCFDDCNNFMGGYFLLHGKRLFSEIFFNHNPFMAYVSYFVQLLTTPENIYELILRHRQALLLFSFILNALLIVRFGFPAFGFTIFYELTKFYLFGDRFLAEGFIVYPLVYLTAIVLTKLRNKATTAFDYIISGIFTWFIIFMREPYVPAALFLFVCILWGKKISRIKIVSLVIFLVLSILTFFLHDIKEFIFNAVTVNIALVGMESTNIGIKIFFYPILLFFGGEWSHFRYVILSLSSLFIISSVILTVKKQWKPVLFAWILLGLLNVRYVEPGKVFYAAFHLLCWYGVFIFISFMMLFLIYKSNKKISYLMMILYSIIFFIYVTSPMSFFNSKSNPHEEFINNYGTVMQIGTVINNLSYPSDTLFLDGFDDIIYWQAKRFSDYKYSWYTSLMPAHKKYTEERLNMFANNPPDFYYGSCPGYNISNATLPDSIKKDYIRLNSGSKPSCLWVHKTKLTSITDEQWKKAEFSSYFFPKE